GAAGHSASTPNGARTLDAHHDREELVALGSAWRLESERHHFADPATQARRAVVRRMRRNVVDREGELLTLLQAADVFAPAVRGLVIGDFDQFDAIAFLEVSHLTDLGEGFGAAAVAHEHLGAIAEFGLAIRVCHLSFLSRKSPARGRASGFTRRGRGYSAALSS